MQFAEENTCDDLSPQNCHVAYTILSPDVVNAQQLASELMTHRALSAHRRAQKLTRALVSFSELPLDLDQRASQITSNAQQYSKINKVAAASAITRKSNICRLRCSRLGTAEFFLGRSLNLFGRFTEHSAFLLGQRSTIMGGDA